MGGEGGSCELKLFKYCVSLQKPAGDFKIIMYNYKLFYAGKYRPCGLRRLVEVQTMI